MPQNDELNINKLVLSDNEKNWQFMDSIMQNISERISSLRATALQNVQSFQNSMVSAKENPIKRNCLSLGSFQMSSKL